MLLGVAVLAFGLPQEGPFTVAPAAGQAPESPVADDTDETASVADPIGPVTSPIPMTPSRTPTSTPPPPPTPPVAPTPAAEPDQDPEVLPPEDSDSEPGLALPGLPGVPVQTLPEPLTAAGEETGDLLISACGSFLTYVALLRLLSGGTELPEEFVPVVQALLDYPAQISVACAVLRAAGTSTECEIDTDKFPALFDVLGIDAPVPPPAGLVGQTIDVGAAIESVFTDQLGVDPVLSAALIEGFGCETTDIDA